MIDLRLGDCLEILPTLEGVDVIVTDPPYGLNFPYLSYEDTRENLISLIDKFMPLARSLAERVFVLCGPTQINLYPQADWVSIVTWNTTGSFGKYGYSQWTPVLCYGSDLSGFGNVNGVTKTDTIKLNGGGGVGFARGEDEKQHTCPKPITMMRSIIQRLTSPDDVVLDFFMGSGTTGVSCVELGRSFIGIEKEPKYFDIASRRIAEAQQQMVMPL